MLTCPNDSASNRRLYSVNAGVFCHQYISRIALKMKAPYSSKTLCPPANDTSHLRTLLRPLSDLKNRTEAQCFHVESTLKKTPVRGGF